MPVAAASPGAATPGISAQSCGDLRAEIAVVISNLLVAQPGAVIPTWGALIVALLVGQAIYRFRRADSRVFEAARALLVEVFGATQLATDTTWRRLVTVYEGDVDRLYRVAFAYQQADSDAAARLPQRPGGI